MLSIALIFAELSIRQVLEDSEVVDLDAQSSEIGCNEYDYEEDSDLESEPDSDRGNLSEADIESPISDMLQDISSARENRESPVPTNTGLIDSPVITPNLTGNSSTSRCVSISQSFSTVHQLFERGSLDPGYTESEMPMNWTQRTGRMGHVIAIEDTAFRT